MPLIIEDGSGVAAANSYVNEAFALAYLTDRNRQGENLWEGRTDVERQAALISATDYIENEYGWRFLGKKEFAHLTHAKAVFSLTANPLDADEVVVGSITYTFNTVISGDNSVLIGPDPFSSLENLILAINANNPDIMAGQFVDSSFVASAKKRGPQGNGLETTTTVIGASWSSSTLKGGATPGSPQPLSFPRADLHNDRGTAITGIPIPLKQACVEYAVRAVAAKLAPDPEYGAGSITRRKEKVGVLEEDTSYSQAYLSRELKKFYPMADKLLRQYLGLTNRIIR